MSGHGAWQTVRAVFGRPTPKFKARLETCFECQMYFSDFMSCGVPGNVWIDAKGTRKALGCGCFLPLGNRLPDKDCWAKFHGLDFGWEEPLRPKKKD